ncbi:hypothetical protein WAZ07_22075 [Bacillus sp. FJAT-51639]|uniref:Uncharacterized protein n=1 Tax=Bacillus bruguierae TaxID=3127667 RepID=A0ABU8FMF4_9BACI
MNYRQIPYYGPSSFLYPYSYLRLVPDRVEIPQQIDELKKEIGQLRRMVYVLQVIQRLSTPSIVKIPYTKMYNNQPDYGTVTINVGLPNIIVVIEQESGDLIAAGFTGADGRITFENVPVTHSMGARKYAIVEDLKYTGMVHISSSPGKVETYDLPVSLR